MKSSLWSVSAVLCFATSALAAPTVVSTCGQAVFEGVLAADLDCSSTSSPAVVLQDGGSLDLAGFVLVSGASDAVSCEGDCTVVGGSLVNGDTAPYPLYNGVRSNFRDLRSAVFLHEVNIDGFSLAASANRLSVEGCVISGGRNGVSAKRLTVSTSEFHHIEYDAVTARNGLVRDSWVHDIGTGGIRFILRGRLENTSVTANGSYGVLGGRVSALDSTIDGNCVSPPIGEFPCADVMTLFVRKPSDLQGTTCSTSLAGTGDPLAWATMGICSLD